MKRGYVFFVVVGLVALPNPRVQAQRRGQVGGDHQEAGQNGWLFSLDEGKAQALKSGKPLMVVIRCVP